MLIRPGTVTPNDIFFDSSVQVEDRQESHFDSTSNRRAAPSARMKTNFVVKVKSPSSLGINCVVVLLETLNLKP